MSKTIFILICILSFRVSAKNIEENNESYPITLITRNFELNHYPEIVNKFPELNNKAYFSILGCISLLYSKEIEMRQVAKARLKGIATQLFREGIPLKLISGLESALIANKENENMEDDSQLIYISIGDCSITEPEQIAKDIFNGQTTLLIAKK